MSISTIIREYVKKMLAEAGKGMKVLLVDTDTVYARSIPSSSEPSTLWTKLNFNAMFVLSLVNLLDASALLCSYVRTWVNGSAIFDEDKIRASTKFGYADGWKKYTSERIS